MATKEQAIQNYNSNAPAGSGRWQSKVSKASAEGSYCAGIAQFLGTATGAECTRHQTNWAAGVTGAESRYKAGVTDKGNDWYEGYKDAMS